MINPIGEIKKAAAVAAKYGVNIYALNSDEGNGDKPAVLMRDVEAFKALPVGGNSRSDYCLASFIFQKEEGGEYWQRVQKISGGVKFWIDLPFESADFNELDAELGAYIDNWDKTHGKKFFYINKE